jgi:stalled ribosome rescue protein Dom34
MSEYLDAVVFIDRREAKVFHFSASADVKIVLMHDSAQRRHHSADHEDSTRHAVDDDFLRSVVGSLDHTGHTLIAGPGNSKFELQAHMQRHNSDLASRISGIETLEDAEDGAILALARHFFGTRGHRHAVTPGLSFRHNDGPSKA